MGFYQIDARGYYFDHYHRCGAGCLLGSPSVQVSDRVITGYSYLVYIIPAPVAYFVVQQGATAINNIVVENGGEKIFYVTGISTPGVTGFWDTTIDMAAHYVVPTFCMTISDGPAIRLLSGNTCSIT